MKLERIFALLGTILSSGLFILVIVLATTGASKNYLMAVISSLVFIPIMLYTMGFITRVLKSFDPLEGIDDDARQTLSDTTDMDLRDELR